MTTNETDRIAREIIASIGQDGLSAGVGYISRALAAAEARATAAAKETENVRHILSSALTAAEGERDALRSQAEHWKDTAIKCEDTFRAHLNEVEVLRHAAEDALTEAQGREKALREALGAALWRKKPTLPDGLVAIPALSARGEEYWVAEPAALALPYEAKGRPPEVTSGRLGGEDQGESQQAAKGEVADE